MEECTEKHSLSGADCRTSGSAVAMDPDPMVWTSKCHGERTVAGADVREGHAVTYGRKEASVEKGADPRRWSVDVGRMVTTHIDTVRDGVT